MHTIVLADDNRIALSYNQAEILPITGTLDDCVNVLRTNPEYILSIGTRNVHRNTLQECEDQGLDPVVHLHLKAERHHYLVTTGPAESYGELCIYEEQIRDMCKENGWILLIDDELQEYINQREEI